MCLRIESVVFVGDRDKAVKWMQQTNTKELQERKWLDVEDNSKGIVKETKILTFWQIVYTLSNLSK